MTVAHKNLGGSFNDFLEEEGILEECTQTAIKFNPYRNRHELRKSLD